MADRLELVGDELFFGSYRIATLDAGLWSSLRDQVSHYLLIADPTAHEEELNEADKAHDDEIAYLEREHGRQIEELENEIAYLKAQLEKEPA